jgi:hypothetical protein
MWRAFVYNSAKVDSDRAKRAYLEFKPHGLRRALFPLQQRRELRETDARAMGNLARQSGFTTI